MIFNVNMKPMLSLLRKERSRKETVCRKSRRNFRTLGYKLSSNGEYRDAKHTTPQAPELQATLRMIKDVEKIDNVVMEVSSHALEQNRVGGCQFNGAVLTNLTQDHLDYHITMENYFEAKALSILVIIVLIPLLFYAVLSKPNLAHR